jgi:dipeptidyl aminopeptidase/acylaminoacyl peptidase
MPVQMELSRILIRELAGTLQEVVGLDPVKLPGEFDRFCPVRNVTKKYPPTLLLHGDNDTDVPHQQSVSMTAELKRVGVHHELISIN